LTGHFDPRWLDQTDVAGVTMRDAMQRAGLAPADIAKLKRDPSRYLGFVEVHIEQGPVLNGLDVPLGIVTSINGSVRYLCEITGMASQPAPPRWVAARCRRVPVSRFVEARLACRPLARSACCRPSARSTSCRGCRLASTSRHHRGARFVRATLAELARICKRRGLQYTVDDARSGRAPAWQQRWSGGATLNLLFSACPAAPGTTR
jgi:N-carbamoyl-L-amino-acid hydrolase